MDQDPVKTIVAYRRVRPIVRAIIAQAREPQSAVQFARREWPNDRDTVSIIQKGGVVPTDTTTTGVSTFQPLVDFLPVLGPVSASAALIRAAIKLNFGAASGLKIPQILSSGTYGAPFVGQGVSFPFKQLSFSSSLLMVKKLAVGFAVTSDLYEHSNGEPLIRQVIEENTNLSLDSILFDSGAATSIRPAGLLNGVTPITAAAGGSQEAMVTDLTLLAAAVAGVASGQIAFIASPVTAIKIQMRRMANNIPFPVFSSAVIAAGTVIAIALPALVFAGDSGPRIEVSDQGTVTMEDTAPLPIGTAGTPPIIASPVSSLWQQSLVGVRLIQEIDWMLRASGAVAYTTSVSW